MQKIYRSILDSKDSQMRDTIWYSLGSICSSASSMIILLIVTRIMGQETSGVFSLAWSAAQLMLTIGWFSTRQYQVSDVDEKIGYYEYMAAKVVSSVVMILVGVIYSFVYNYDKETKIVTWTLCVLMIAEVFADFFSSYFQQQGKLHISGKSYVIRNIGYVSAFCTTLLFWENLIFSIICALMVETVWLFLFDYQLVKMIPKKDNILKKSNVVKIFVECLPLFIGSFVMTFIVNIPKNAIHMYMDNNSQAIYNVLFLPTSVINMFNMFVCVPFYVKLAVLWKNNDKREFMRNVYQITGIVMVITIGVLLGGSVLGIPVLSWLYNIDLQGYQSAFLVLLIGGGFYGIISLLIYVITVFRKQKILTYVYLTSAILAHCFVGILVRDFGLLGASVTYMFSLGIICMILMLYIKYYLNKLSEQS